MFCRLSPWLIITEACKTHHSRASFSTILLLGLSCHISHPSEPHIHHNPLVTVPCTHALLCLDDSLSFCLRKSHLSFRSQLKGHFFREDVLLFLGITKHYQTFPHLSSPLEHLSPFIVTWLISLASRQEPYLDSPLVNPLPRQYLTWDRDALYGFIYNFWMNNFSCKEVHWLINVLLKLLGKGHSHVWIIGFRAAFHAYLWSHPFICLLFAFPTNCAFVDSWEDKGFGHLSPSFLPAPSAREETMTQKTNGPVSLTMVMISLLVIFLLDL